MSTTVYRIQNELGECQLAFHIDSVISSKVHTKDVKSLVESLTQEQVVVKCA